MTDLALVALVGFLASIVDGALGMGFGPTSSTLLLATGFSPVSTSATVNLAKVATGFAAAISHWRIGNIDRRLVLRLAGPGAIGAIVGTTVLVTVDGGAVRPIMAIILLAVGIKILIRFGRSPSSAVRKTSSDTDAIAGSLRSAGLAGTAGGITNGLVGTWGPVVTPWLMNRGIEPRYAIGSTNTAEVAVAIVSVGSLITSTSGSGFNVSIALAMIVGGILAAPLGALAVRVLSARVLGVGVGALLVLTQGWELTKSLTAPIAILRGGVVLAGVGLLAILVSAWRRRRSISSQAGIRLTESGANTSPGSPGVGIIDQ